MFRLFRRPFQPVQRERGEISCRVPAGQVGDLDQPPLLPVQGLPQHLAGPIGWMTDPSNEKVALAEHPVIGPEDGQAAGDLLQIRWVDTSLTSLRDTDGPLRRMVRQKDGQRHRRVRFFAANTARAAIISKFP